MNFCNIINEGECSIGFDCVCLMTNRKMLPKSINNANRGQLQIDSRAASSIANIPREDGEGTRNFHRGDIGANPLFVRWLVTVCQPCKCWLIV